MSLHTENLGRESTTEAVQQAISDTISQCMAEGGRSKEQCTAIALESARQRTGRGLGQGGTKVRQGLAVEDGR